MQGKPLPTAAALLAIQSYANQFKFLNNLKVAQQQSSAHEPQSYFHRLL